MHLPIRRRGAEISGPGGANCVDEQTAVEVQVSRLAAGLRDQEAAVACRAVQRPVFIRMARVMIRADRIARAQGEAFEGP